MTTILALDPDIGWAFAQEDNCILLLRPPYRDIQNARVVLEPVVERAVIHHGYRAYSQHCESLAEAIAWIRAQVVRNTQALWDRTAQLWKKLGERKNGTSQLWGGA